MKIIRDSTAHPKLFTVGRYRVLLAQSREKHVIGQTLIKKVGRSGTPPQLGSDWFGFVCRILGRRCPEQTYFAPSIMWLHHDPYTAYYVRALQSYISRNQCLICIKYVGGSQRKQKQSPKHNHSSARHTDLVPGSISGVENVIEPTGGATRPDVAQPTESIESKLLRHLG